MFSSSYKRLHCPSGMKLSLLPFRVHGQHRGARDSKYCAALPDCHQGAMTKGHSGPVLDLFALHPVQKGLWIPQTCNTSHPHDAVPFLKCLLSAKVFFPNIPNIWKIFTSEAGLYPGFAHYHASGQNPIPGCSNAFFGIFFP